MIIALLLQQLLDVRSGCTLAGNEEAYVMVKDMATWVQQYVESILERRGQSQWQIALNTEWGGMNEALFNLHGLTGDPNHLVTANYFNHFSWTAPLAINVDDLAGQHANTHIPEIVGAARGYELTQNVTQRDITVNFWNILNSTRTYATGGSSDNEHWGPPHRLGDELNANTEESCTTYNILKVCVACLIEDCKERHDTGVLKKITLESRNRNRCLHYTRTRFSLLVLP
jgi:DUF1680 family protein